MTVGERETLLLVSFLFLCETVHPPAVSHSGAYSALVSATGANREAYITVLNLSLASVSETALSLLASGFVQSLQNASFNRYVFKVKCA